jgi:hypothetical protein
MTWDLLKGQMWKYSSHLEFYVKRSTPVKREVLPMAECKVIHPDGLETEVRSGSMTRLAGVSEGLVGSTGIHLSIATIPPGCASSPHYHVNCESAIYVVKGAGGLLLDPIWKTSCPSAQETLSTSHPKRFTSR